MPDASIDLRMFSEYTQPPSSIYRAHIVKPCSRANCTLVPPIRPRPTQDFALGDFDDTPIAKMEQEKEVATNGSGEESGDTVEDSGVAGLLHVVTESPGEAEAPQAKSRKPLIEEL